MAPMECENCGTPIYRMGFPPRFEGDTDRSGDFDVLGIASTKLRSVPFLGETITVDVACIEHARHRCRGNAYLRIHEYCPGAGCCRALHVIL